MISSILNGRLESQLNKLVAQKIPARMIVLEGPLENTNLKGFSLDELRTCILTIQLRWKIQMILSQSLADTLNWIRLLVEFRKNRQPTIRPNYRGVSKPSAGTGRSHRQHDAGLNS